jgi:LPXTG-site transpeptidase (sortase) family protein
MYSQNQGGTIEISHSTSGVIYSSNTPSDKFLPIHVKLESSPNFANNVIDVIPETTLRVAPKSNSLNKFLHVVSKLMILSAVVLTLLFTAPLIAVELQYTIDNRIPLVSQPYIPGSDNSKIATSGLLKPILDKITPPTEQRFQVVIPKINVDSNVIANVDASDPDNYNEALKQGLAHAKGTNFPGLPENEDVIENTSNTIFIFGHSTDGIWNIDRFNALFYNLRYLEPGDDIFVWFWGVKYHYRVAEKGIYEPDDISFLTDSGSQERLVLQTCWPPGSIDKRLIITAYPVE